MSLKGISPISEAVARHRSETTEISERTGGLDNPGEAFESMMLRKMVQSLQATVPESGLWSGVTGGQIYDHFIEQALSDHISEAGGIGIAELFNEQEGSQTKPTEVLAAASLNMESSGTHDPSAEAALPVDDPARPLAELLPPQYDSWLNSPSAEQTLRASLEDGKLRSSQDPTK